MRKNQYARYQRYCNSLRNTSSYVYEIRELLCLDACKGNHDDF